jgi:serine/threonine protein kinase
MDQWQQIESLFEQALNRPATEREPFLRQARAGGAELFREARSLVVDHRHAESQDSGQWAAVAAVKLIPLPTRLKPGQSPRPYRIVSFIAEGGMAAVYRSRYTRLGRKVAIKFSQSQFSDRFQREDSTIASLNHSNVCTLHDVGPNYPVMEYVEGADLKGPVPLERALEIAGQIAAALEAREVHRASGSEVWKHQDQAGWLGKVVGLRAGKIERAVRGHAGFGILSASRMILGTAGYISPEQAGGQAVDKRADIFAFGGGAVLVDRGRAIVRRGDGDRHD